MHRLFAFALLAGAVVMSSHAAESRPITPEERDFLTYLQSVGAPTMKEVCEPLYGKMPGTNDKIDAWIAQNGEAIGRGRTFQAARLQGGETIEKYETGVRYNLTAMLAAATPEKIARQCVAFLFMTTPVAHKPEGAAPAPASAEPAAPAATAPSPPATDASN